MTHRDNFRSWFADHIRLLSGKESAGFLITIATFPLLERYVKQLTNAEPKSPKFLPGLRKVLPDLDSDDAARTFWTTYRHGLLHNVTMSRETHGLTHDSLKAVEVHASGKVWLHPVLFSERVLSVIENDFATFEGGPKPLPVVYGYVQVPEHPGAPNYYQGTGTLPGQGGKP
jgi:hypothetical protein